MTLPPEEIVKLMRFIENKTKNVKSPMSIRQLARQFIKESGSLMALRGVASRIDTYRQRIHKMDEFEMETKVKMMFALSAPIEKGFLNELKKQADVEVDEKGRITKYQSKDGSLKLEGSHEKSSIQRSLFSDRWQKVCQKANDDESEDENDEDTNGQKDYENKRMVRFLIERTKNATSPWSIEQLATDYKKEFKCSESQHCICLRIKRFRQRIHEVNQFDKPTKVKMMFALSSSVDADFLQKLRKDAIVELDDNQKIKKYKAEDRRLELERNYGRYARVKTASAKMTRIINNSNESTGVKYAQSARLSQNLAAIQKGRKRARVAYSSSKISKEKYDDEESMTKEMMEYDTNNAEDGRYDYFYHDPPYYEEDIDHILMEVKPESLIEAKAEGSSTSNSEYRYEERFFYYDPSTYEKDLEHYPEEKKPENLIEVKTELPKELSTNNLEYHYEDILTEPKPE